MAILSFQSRVVWGHVGNSVAEFALRRIGVDVWPIDTICLSHHPGHGQPRGRLRTAAELDELVTGLSESGALCGCNAVLSGYLGSAANGRVVLRAAEALKARRTDALYCCDPVMGDRHTGLYVQAELVRFFRDEALIAADILTPNHFELETLVEAPLTTLQQVVAAADQLRERGPPCVLVSSITTGEHTQKLATLLVEEGGAWLAATPRLELRAHGAGDLLAAQFLARWMRGEAADTCLSGAVAATYAVLQATRGARELRLVAAQEAMAASPRCALTVTRLR